MAGKVSGNGQVYGRNVWVSGMRDILWKGAGGETASASISTGAAENACTLWIPVGLAEAVWGQGLVTFSCAHIFESSESGMAHADEEFVVVDMQQRDANVEHPCLP